jgi:hypothetical protein
VVDGGRGFKLSECCGSHCVVDLTNMGLCKKLGAGAWLHAAVDIDCFSLRAWCTALG